MTRPDIETLAAGFAAIGWSKPPTTFATYLEDEQAGRRWTRVAEWNGVLAGYITVAWQSPDPHFAASGIPEVMDLNVLPDFRRQGIGGHLLTEAETEAVHRGVSVLGLRVGLHGGYGAAQRLYVIRGYVPDGTGAVRDGVVVPEQGMVALDDEVTLRMTKQLDGS